MAAERNTRQKVLIAQALCDLPHPTAADVYKQVQRDLPSVSLGTVYRVLSRMADEGHLLRVHFANGDDVFDVTVTPHCHIRCRTCGKVRDVVVNLPPVSHVDVLGDAPFLLEETHLEFIGVCQACQPDKQ